MVCVYKNRPDWEGSVALLHVVIIIIITIFYNYHCELYCYKTYNDTHNINIVIISNYGTN